MESGFKSFFINGNALNAAKMNDSALVARLIKALIVLVGFRYVRDMASVLLLKL